MWTPRLSLANFFDRMMLSVYLAPLGFVLSPAAEAWSEAKSLDGFASMAAPTAIELIDKNCRLP
jgi:hypothetical protein